MSVERFDTPLEQWFLKRIDKEMSQLKGIEKYADRYKVCKKSLMEIAQWNGAALSSRETEEVIFTDHGPDHFDNVIYYAGALLGLDDLSETPIEEQKIKPNEYEVFIILMAILLHDVGNVYGRTDHEKQPLNIMRKLGTAVCPDDVEARSISKIAEAHGGKVIDQSGKSNKDTIHHLIHRDVDTYGNYKYHPRAIAALVRFADEICESRGRGARFLLENDALSQASKIFHDYAESITSANVDVKGKTINISYHLTDTKVIENYSQDEEQKKFLVDEIVKRLEKMHCELRYCNRFMTTLTSIEQIRATVEIYEQSNGNKIKEKTFELKEYGYPLGIFSFEDHYPEWCGEKIKDEILQLRKNKDLSDG